MFDKGHELLVEGLGCARRMARESAELLDCLAQFVALHPGSDGEFVPLEVAAAFKWTVSFAQKRIGLAVALTSRLPATFKALRAGRDR